MQSVRMKIALLSLVAAVAAGLVAFGACSKVDEKPMAAKDVYCTLMLLTESNGGKTPVRAMVDNVKSSLAKEGKGIVVVHVEKENSKFESLCQRYAIRSFPSVVVIGRACGETAIVIQEGLSKTSLLAAIAKASDLKAPCAFPRGSARK